MSAVEPGGITSVLCENRVFPPPPAFAAQAHIGSIEEYEKAWRRSIEDPEGFWGQIARDLHWFKPWSKVCEWNLPDARWFVGASTNLSSNCLDRQVECGRGSHPAIVWEGEPVASSAGDATGRHEIRTLTYEQLLKEVCRFAHALRGMGVRKGDRVTIYMPMVPELAIAMLACARIGAPHSVIFGGFSPQAIVDRVEDAQSRVIITADMGYRRGKPVPLKANVNEACLATTLVNKVIVFRRGDGNAPMMPGRDHWWHDVVKGQPDACPAEPLDAEHMLYLLYTSGSTGKPKGIHHTTGGYMVHTYLTSKYIFDLKPDDVYWCTADIGWVTGHSYIVYGILANGVTVAHVRGRAQLPRLGPLLGHHRAAQGDASSTPPRPPSARSCGRALSTSKSMIFHRSSCSAPSASRSIPRRGCGITRNIGGRAMPDRRYLVADRNGRDHDHAAAGRDADQARLGHAAVLRRRCGHRRCRRARCSRPTPAACSSSASPGPACSAASTAIASGSSVNTSRRFPGMYFTGDAARQDEDGYFWIMGRVDDVINVAGHRLGTAEVESALVSHPAVAEAAVVPIPHDIKGQGIVAFCTLKVGFAPSPELADELMQSRGPHHGLDRPPRADPLRRRRPKNPQRQNHAPPAQGTCRQRRDPRRHHDARRHQRHRPPPSGRGMRRSRLESASAETRARAESLKKKKSSQPSQGL